MNAANRRGFLKFAGAGRGRGRSRRHRHTSAAPGKISTADQPRELRASGRGGRVVGRLTRSSHVPCPTGRTVHSLVFGRLHRGTYDLYVRPDGPIRLTVADTGGQVAQAAFEF